MDGRWTGGEEQIAPEGVLYSSLIVSQIDEGDEFGQKEREVDALGDLGTNELSPACVRTSVDVEGSDSTSYLSLLWLWRMFGLHARALVIINHKDERDGYVRVRKP